MKKTISKSLSISYIALIINTAISFISVPITLTYFGQDLYGIFSITNDLIYYFSLLSFGIPWVAATVFANAKTFRARRVVIKRSISLLAIISALILLSLILANLFLPHWVNILGIIPRNITEISRQFVIASIIIFVLRLPISIFNQLLVFLGKIYIVKYIEIFNSFATFSILLLVCNLKLSVLHLVILNGVLSLIVNCLYLYCFYREWTPESDDNEDFSNPEFTSYRYIITSGWYVLITNIAGIVIWNTDNLVISHALGMADVAKYSIIFKMFLLLSNITTQILNVINPLYPKFYSTQKYQQMEELFTFSNRLFPIIGGLAFIVLFGGSYPFMVLWTHSSIIYPGYLTAFCLACYAYFTWNSVIAYWILNCLNLNKKIYKLTSLEAILNLILSICLVKVLGIAGVILGTLIAHFVVEFVMIPRVLYHSFEYKLRFDYRYVFKHISLALVPTAILLYYANIHLANQLWKLLITLVLITVFYLLASLYVFNLKYLKLVLSKYKMMQN